MKKNHLKSRKSKLALLVFVVGAVIAGSTGWYFHHRPYRIDGIRNVVLISIDTCRADHLSCYGYNRPTTPNIDAVARDGVLFRQALSPVPFTTPAHSSMVTGTYPPTHGVRLNNGEVLADYNVTLAEILQKAGYQTAAFVGGFPLDSKFGLNQGFDTYDCRFTRIIATSSDKAERTAEEVSRPALAWLEEHAGKPFFLFLHYYDAHLTYEPPPPYASAYAEDPYTGEIAYVDSWIGQVVDRLRALGVYGNTLLIITADHGESLGEHGERSHGFFVYQSTLHVPLVIRAPQGQMGSRFEGRVSLVDLMPTVLDLVGLKSPSQVQGVSLRHVLEGGPVPDDPRLLYCESLEATQFQCSSLMGVVEGSWKYIRAPKQELYDLTRDSGETSNIIEKQPQIAQRLRGRLEAMLQEMESAAPQHGLSTVDPDAAKRLQSLGYVGGGATPTRSAFEPELEDPKDFVPTFERLEEANSLFHSNRGREAEKELLEIVGSRPGLIAAHEQLAQIARHEHRPADAVRHYAKIVAVLTESANPSKSLLTASGDLATAHFNLAFALREMGKDGEAIGHYEQALRIQPDYVDAHNSLGLALVRAGKFDEAIAHYRQALGIQPDHVQVHNNLGNVLQQTGKFAEALGHYEQALRIQPDYVDAHNNLGLALVQAGKFSEAIAHYERALRIQPDQAQVHSNLGDVLQQTGKFAEALGHYERALRIQPDSPSALNRLAWIRATSGNPQLRNGAEAVRLAEHACAVTGGNNGGCLDTLAAAYAESRRFDEAVATAQEALAWARSARQTAIADAIQSRVALYRDHHPYRAVAGR